MRSHVSEPDRGRRKWKDKSEAQVAVYGNRRRIRSPRGNRLQKRRAEIVERGFAHAYDTGGMRRLHLRGRGNILKRLLIHIAGFNLSLIMRKLLGTGTPRAFAALLRSLRSLYEALRSTLGAQGHRFWRRHRTIIKITLNDIAYAC